MSQPMSLFLTKKKLPLRITAGESGIHAGGDPTAEDRGFQSAAPTSRSLPLTPNNEPTNAPTYTARTAPSRSVHTFYDPRQNRDRGRREPLRPRTHQPPPAPRGRTAKVEDNRDQERPPSPRFRLRGDGSVVDDYTLPLVKIHLPIFKLLPSLPA